MRVNVTSKKWLGVLVAMLLFACVAEFAIRGPVWLLQAMGWNDFLSPYIQANAWAHGKDPYSAQTLVSFWPPGNSRPPWVDTEAANGTLEMTRGIPSPYPVTSFVVLSPFALLPWPLALILWGAVNLAAIALAPFALLSVCGIHPFELRAQLFLAAVFALAPLHTGLATANPAMLAVGLSFAAFWAAHSGKLTTDGILLALAICLKPTVAGGLLLYYVVRRQWKVAGVACALSATIALIGISRLALPGVPWFSSYFENTRHIFAPGSMDDFTRPDAIRFNMINAQVLFYSLLRNATIASRLSLLLGVTLLGCWLWLCYRRRTRSELIAISAISVLSLIAGYHRFYDAALLIWPLTWSLLVVRKRSTSFVILLTIVPFLVPGATLLSDRMGSIPPAIVNGWWWRALVAPHRAWDLIFLAILPLYFLARKLSEASPPDPLLPPYLRSPN
ncbi:MAG: glycosyltransferase family 87 protein [Candidatus Sulfotelmatobacter sp.]